MALFDVVQLRNAFHGQHQGSAPGVTGIAYSVVTGNTLVVIAHDYYSATGGITISDDGGHTWVAVTSNYDYPVWVATNVTGGHRTITISGATGGFNVWMGIFEITGNGSTLEAEAICLNGGSGNAYACTSLTTAGAAVIVGHTSANQGARPQAPAGFTDPSAYDNDGDQFTFRMSWKNVSSAATTSITGIMEFGDSPSFWFGEYVAIRVAVTSLSLAVPVLPVDWTIPSQSVVGTGVTPLSIPVLPFNWGFPSFSLAPSGSVLLSIGAIVANWVLPSQVVVPSGSAPLSISAVPITWVIPAFALAQSGATPLVISSVSIDWGIPSQSLLVGTTLLAINSVGVNWGFPVVNLSVPAVVDLVEMSTSVWGVPSQSLSGTGSIGLSVGPILINWFIPSVLLTGGKSSGSGSNALSGQSSLTQGEIGEIGIF